MTRNLSVTVEFPRLDAGMIDILLHFGRVLCTLYNYVEDHQTSEKGERKMQRTRGSVQVSVIFHPVVHASTSTVDCAGGFMH